MIVYDEQVYYINIRLLALALLLSEIVENTNLVYNLQSIWKSPPLSYKFDEFDIAVKIWCASFCANPGQTWERLHSSSTEYTMESC